MGNGLWSTPPTLLTIGNDTSAGRALNGYALNLRVCRPAGAVWCR